MGYRALVSIDLPDASVKQRETFYEYLEKEKWVKIKNLTTSWKMLFHDTLNREQCKITIIADLKNAENTSKVNKVDFAFLLGKMDVQINKL